MTRNKKSSIFENNNGLYGLYVPATSLVQGKPRILHLVHSLYPADSLQ